MFGRLRYSPDEYYGMGFSDMLCAIEGFGDEQIEEANRLRHLMWAPMAAMGSKVTPKRIMPLPIDGVANEESTMTKEQFLLLGKMYKNKGKA